MAPSRACALACKNAEERFAHLAPNQGLGGRKFNHKIAHLIVGKFVGNLTGGPESDQASVALMCPRLGQEQRRIPLGSVQELISVIRLLRRLEPNKDADCGTLNHAGPRRRNAVRRSSAVERY